MNDTSTELKAEVKKNLASLQALRDEVRVKIHLAGMNLKDQWRKLEPRLDEVEKAAHDISEASRAALKEAVKRLEQLRDSIRGRSASSHGGPGNDVT